MEAVPISGEASLISQDRAATTRGTLPPNADNKDEEIRSLKEQLSRYNHISSAPKNGNSPQNRGEQPSSGKKPTNQEVVDFISQIMQTLQNYKTLLAN